MNGIIDYYNLLQVSSDATSDEIKQSFRYLAQKHHPDKNDNSPDSKLLFQSILEAYRILSSSSDRTAYDSYMKTSPVVKKQRESASTVRHERVPAGITPDADRLVEDIKSQLNFILWEIEDLIFKKDRDLTLLIIGDEIFGDVIIRILAFFDKWILHPAGEGDYFYTARALDVRKPYSPLDNQQNHAHRPYVDSEDYFFQIRRRFDRFMNRLRKSDLQSTIPGADVTIMDSLFEAVNMSFHYLAAINTADSGLEQHFSPYVFSRNIFDEKQQKRLSG